MYQCRNLKKPETQKELIGAVDGGTGTIGSHVAKLYHLYFKQKSEVSAQKLSAQRLQQLFPILHEKGSFYSRTAIRSKQTDYANFQ